MSQKFKNEIRWIVFIFVLGISLTVYAHKTFVTKDEVNTMKSTTVRELDSIKSILRTIDERIYEIHSRYFSTNKEKMNGH